MCLCFLIMHVCEISHQHTYYHSTTTHTHSISVTPHITSWSLLTASWSHTHKHTGTDYELTVSYFALGWFDLILNFAFDLPIFIALFIFMGALTCFLCWLCWLAARVSTILKNPPSMKVSTYTHIHTHIHIPSRSISLHPHILTHNHHAQQSY